MVDLEICPGVDSTFMGALAGLARKCMAAGGSVQVAYFCSVNICSECMFPSRLAEWNE